MVVSFSTTAQYDYLTEDMHFDQFPIFCYWRSFDFVFRQVSYSFQKKCHQLFSSPYTSVRPSADASTTTAVVLEQN